MSSPLRSTFIVMFLAGVSKVLGLLREMTMASAYGLSEAMDAFLVASLMPQFVSSMMQSGVIKTFVSLYCETDKERGMQAAACFTKTLLVGTFFFGLMLYLLLDIFKGPILHMIAPGFTPDKHDLATKLLDIMMPCFILMVSTDILSAYQQAKGSFFYSTSGPIVYNIATVVFVTLLASTQGIYAAAIAYLASVILQFILQLYGSYCCGLWQVIGVTIDFKCVKRFGVLILPILAGIAFFQINTVIDRIFASGLPDGSISALNYAYKIYWLVIACFVIPLSTAFFPALAKLFNCEKMLFAAKVRRLTSLLIFISLPISIFVIILAQPIISMIYQRGAFSAAAVMATSEILTYYLVGLVAQVLVILFLDLAYVMKNSQLALIAAVVMTCCNALMNCFVVDNFRAPGLAVSTALSQVIGFLLLYSVMVSRYKILEPYFIICELVKTATLCLVPSLFIIGWQYLALSYSVKPLTIVAVGAMVYGLSFLVCALVSKRSELTDIIDLISTRPIFHKVKSLINVGGNP